jgi:hypothetical protein
MSDETAKISDAPLSGVFALRVSVRSALKILFGDRVVKRDSRHEKSHAGPRGRPHVHVRVRKNAAIAGHQREGDRLRLVSGSLQLVGLWLHAVEDVT